ncbi:MAG: hypothetical protein LKI39_11995 [Bacteroides sp.]|jgi:hypothetical protein|nr:hypothetical protein [Bacteroides sp.]MCI1683264.1 hypothetical protein [Bacteroides sp.]
MTHKNIHISTDIIINAPRKRIWKVLSKLEGWPEWTTQITAVKGDFKKDGQLTLMSGSHKGDNFIFERTLFLFDEWNYFGWTGNAFEGLKDFHIFELQTLKSNKTRFIQSDGLHGAKIPGIQSMEEQMLKNYKIFNNELKQHIERML